jgi:hypothetical protein
MQMELNVTGLPPKLTIGLKKQMTILRKNPSKV